MPSKDLLPPALMVTGPTASGKSALALALAETLRGAIINADAMQTYRELRILTARPTVEDEARVPHRLYGVRGAAEPGHAAWWREEALAAMAAALAEGRLPIVTGGTGMYLSTLSGGLADVPDPGAEAREEARRLLRDLGPEALHAGLVKVDPATAARIRPGDAQRIARAWEVWRGTGRGLAAWWNHKRPPAPFRFFVIRLDPPREWLRAAIARRFDAMIQGGALEEARALGALGLDRDLPLMRAHGVRELLAHIAGTIPLEEAARRTVLATGQYTKRQATWFRHHPLGTADSCEILHDKLDDCTQFSERIVPRILAFIQKRD